MGTGAPSQSRQFIPGGHPPSSQPSAHTGCSGVSGWHTTVDHVVAGQSAPGSSQGVVQDETMSEEGSTLTVTWTARQAKRYRDLQG